jgi:hypothetical protein
VFDDLEADAVVLRCDCSILSGVALIDIGQFDVIAGDLLHLLRQSFDNRHLIPLPTNATRASRR